jgi:uncharacterized protein (DUF4415 family)
MQMFRAWLKQGGDTGGQKRLNAILRDAMLTASRRAEHS